MQTNTMLSQEEKTAGFVRTMNAMRHHYKSFPTTTYPIHTGLVADAAGEELPEAAKQATTDFHGSLDAFQNNQSDTLSSGSQQFVDDKNFGSFQEQMNANRAKAKSDASQRIDDYYDKMIQVGQDHPAAQNIIVQVTQKVSDFFNSVFDKISNFVTELVSNIIQWVEKALGHIKDFFDNAFSSAASFFGSLF